MKGKRKMQDFSRKNKFKRDFIMRLQYLEEKNHYSDLIFFCIGSDKIIGDCLGPIVGSKIKQKIKSPNIHIIGDLRQPLCYLDSNNCIQKVDKLYEKPCIIAIDAALSCEKNVGKIGVNFEPLCLGKGLGKDFIIPSDLTIKAIVGQYNEDHMKNLMSLQSLSLNFVLQMAEEITEGILETFPICFIENSCGIV